MSELERLAARRVAIWAGAPAEPGELDRIARRLADLYEDRRLERARASIGRTRDEILFRARVESELDRLSSPKETQ